MTPETLTAEGWRQLRAVGFSQHAGPFWGRNRDTALEVGFVANEQHTNGYIHSVHGGMLLTFADICLGYKAAVSLDGQRCVTVQLQMQFLSSAKVGEFIVCRPELLRRSKQLVFLRGVMFSGDRAIASADGIWKILKPADDTGVPEKQPV